MAATTTSFSWKRPWQDDAQTLGASDEERALADNLTFVTPWPQHRLQQPRPPAHAPIPDHAAAAPPTTAHASAHDSASTSTIHKYTTRPSPDFPSPSGPQHQAAPGNPSKRRRLDWPDAAADMPRIRTTDLRGGPRTPRGSLSSASAAEKEDTRRKSDAATPRQRTEESVLARRLANVSTMDSRQSSVWAAAVSPEEDPLHDRVVGESCSTCDRASSVAPQIARGLETLHGQLQAVLARNQAQQASMGVCIRPLTLALTCGRLVLTGIDR